jgi:GxxExxY protein
LHRVHLLHRSTTEKIIGAAFEVHQQLGYGFLERLYQRALQVELLRRGATAETRNAFRYLTKELLSETTIADLVVDGCVIVEIRSLPNTTSEMKLSCSIS